jgi:hypothetical protein
MSGGGGGADDGAGVDLTALMDILSNIIFFLMASFGAAAVTMIPASAPAISDIGDSDVADELDKVTLTIGLKRSGEVHVSAANSGIDPAELAQFSRTFSPLADAKEMIDAKALNDHLTVLKQKFPKSKDAIIVPEGKVTYEQLIKTMDASRERFLEGAFLPLFPAVVVSSIVE